MFLSVIKEVSRKSIYILHLVFLKSNLINLPTTFLIITLSKKIINKAINLCSHKSRRNLHLSELAKIREEIEAKQGRLKYLQSQVSMSTIALRFYKEDVAVQAQASFGSKIVNALKGGWNGVLTFFIGMLYIWPFLLITALVFYLVKRYLKRSRTASPS